MDKDVVKHFLFTYDRKRDHLISVKEYGQDIDSAMVAYQAAEILHHDEPWIDIVLIGSDSLESIKKTHSTYFDGESKYSILRSLAQSLQ